MLSTMLSMIMASYVCGFVVQQQACGRSAMVLNDATLGQVEKSYVDDIRKAVNYTPGGAETEFAERYRHLVGAKVRTVGEAFADFTEELGYSVNPLYKNMVTDIVGSTHLIVVNARFIRDPIWSVGILASTDLLLRNYPERDIGARIISSLFKSVGLDEEEIRAEAQGILDWAKGKTKEDIEKALAGEGDSPLVPIFNGIKEDQFWMYSRYFGIGLIKMMEQVGVEMDKDEVYPIMESWMGEKLSRSPMTACADSDLYFKIRDKLEMMETMMKEIEIREKKRMAERLEDKAEQALRQAEKEGKLAAEIAADNERARENAAS